MVAVVHLLEQLLGERQDGVLVAQHLVLGDGAGDLPEVVELDLEGERAALKVVLLEASHEFGNGVVQFDDHRARFVDVVLKGVLAAHRLALIVDHHGPLVDAAGKVVEHRTHLAKDIG